MAESKETVENYVEFRQQMSKDEFVHRFSHPFLVQREKESGPQSDEFEFTTLQVTREELQSFLGGGYGSGSHLPVQKIVKRASNAFEGMINVGRAQNNDIVLDSPAVSKFHAYFSKDPATGDYCITDADSTNGTFVNGTRLEPHKRHSLSEGDIISFGRAVEFTYYSPNGFYDMLGLFVS